MTKKKKVLFVATVDSHILAFHLPYLELFKQKGWETHVATNGKEKIPFCDHKHTICMERSPFKLNNIKAIKQMKQLLEKEHFDIIHCHTPMGSVVTRLAAKKARKNGTRIIYTAHGFHFYTGAPLINWLLFYLVEWYLAKYTDTLITINHEDYNRAKKKFSKRCRDIQYVPGVGINPKKFDFKMTKKEKHELRASLGLKDDDFVMIFPAELNKNKNQILLINAMEQLVEDGHTNIKLLLPGKDSTNGKYQKITKNKGLEDYIKFLGFRKDIPKLLKISDLAISSSKREGLPVNIIESLYCNLPIIAKKSRGINDLIEKQNSCKIINNKKELINGILSIKSNANAKTTTIKDYTYNNTTKLVSNIYFKKKKIMHLLSSNTFSGAEKVACQISKWLKDDYSFYYCSPDGEIKNKLKIDYESIVYKPLRHFSIRDIKEVIEEIQPDIIHAHDAKATVLAVLSNSLQAKIVSHIHGNHTNMRKMTIKALLFKLTSKKVSKIIWVSKDSLNDYIFHKQIKESSIIVENIIDEDEIKEKTSGENQCDYDLIYVGRLEYPKNPQKLLEIIEIIKEQKGNIRLAVVGNGNDKEAIEAQIKKSGLDKNIDVLGYRNNPYKLISKSRIFIMTSLYEGMPMAALEALCLGKPIISTKVDGLKQIIKNDKNGYLDNDSEVMAKKVLEFLNDEQYKKLSHEALLSFKKYNDKNWYIKQIKEVYGK